MHPQSWPNLHRLSHSLQLSGSTDPQEGHVGFLSFFTVHPPISAFLLRDLKVPDSHLGLDGSLTFL